jgi:hypothetical protein
MRSRGEPRRRARLSRHASSGDGITPLGSSRAAAEMILKGQDLIDGHLDEQAPATAGTQTDRGR